MYIRYLLGTTIEKNIEKKLRTLFFFSNFREDYSFLNDATVYSHAFVQINTHKYTTLQLIRTIFVMNMNNVKLKIQVSSANSVTSHLRQLKQTGSTIVFSIMNEGKKE